MTYRVVQWGTGKVGRLALRAFCLYPELVLAGDIVHRADQVGRDASELCGHEPVSVADTDDVDKLLHSNIECLCYTATGDLRPQDAVDHMCGVLASGVNIVSTSVVSCVYPPSADPG